MNTNVCLLISLFLLAAPAHAANGEVVEGRDRVRLGPQPDTTGLEARVPVIKIELAVEGGLHVVADGHEAEGVPLLQGRWLHGRGGDLAASPIVGVEAEV